MTSMTRPFAAVFAGLFAILTTTQAEAQSIFDWPKEFPLTNYAARSIPLKEIISDGAVRDSIPPIDDPQYVRAAEATGAGDLEPVLSFGIDGDFRAYPISILLWHEIVNDTVGGVPVLVSYCPLCNSGVVYDRRLDGDILEFGNTGRIRHGHVRQTDGELVAAIPRRSRHW